MKNLHERCEQLADELCGTNHQGVSIIESFAREIHKEALEEAAKVVEKAAVDRWSNRSAYPTYSRDIEIIAEDIHALAAVAPEDK